MAEVVLYHNPGCSKSRGALEILEGREEDLLIVEYLKNPLSREELAVLVGQVGGEPSALVRKDKKFKELGLDPGAYETPSAVVEILAEHPELMERPVAVFAGRGVIGRPPEKVLELLG